MSRVATCTNGSYNKALLEQALSMDTVLVSLKNLLLWKIVRALHLVALGVTLCAHARDIEGRRGGVWIAEADGFGII